MSESQPGQSASESSPESVASTRDAEQQTRIAASPFELSQEPVTPEGPAAPAAAVPAPAYEHLGELPGNYGTQSVYLVAYDPRQLFAYWDVDWAAAGDAVHALHVCRPDGEVEHEAAISSADTGRYLAAGRSGGTYYVELGRRGRDGRWQPLAVSGRVTMPPEGLAGESEPQFATLPFHLSFQRLLGLVQGAMGHGEDLTVALARLQRGTPPSETATLLNALDGLDSEQLHTLGLLLGQKFNVSSGPDAGSSPGGVAILRDRHEVISSGGAFGSDTLSSGGAFGSERLSSGGLAAGGGGSEMLPSSAFSSEHGTIHPAPGVLAGGFAGGSENLSSGAFGSETFSAFVAGLSSETLSSFGLSSEMLAAVGAGGSEALSSGSWQLAGLGIGPDSAGMDSERAEVFRRALGSNLDVLSSLFSAVSSGLSSGFSPGASESLSSAGA